MNIANRARVVQDVLFDRPQVAQHMAASLGIAARTWHNNLTGRFAISGLVALRLIAVHRVSAVWLLSGAGPMFGDARPDPIHSASRKPPTVAAVEGFQEPRRG